MKPTERTLEEVIQYLSFCIEVLDAENNKKPRLGLRSPTITIITAVEQIQKVKQTLHQFSDKPGEKN